MSLQIDMGNVLKAANELYPILIGKFMGMALAAPVTLKFWLAAQHATDIPVVADESSANTKKGLKYNLWKLAAISIFLVVYFGTLTALYLNAAKIYEWVIVLGYSFWLYTAFFTLTGDITGSVTWAVHRTSEGALSPILQQIQRPRKWLLLGISFILTMASLKSPTMFSPYIEGLCVAAMVHLLSRNLGVKTFAMRYFVPLYTGLCLFAVVAGVGAAMLMGTHSGKQQGADPMANNDAWRSVLLTKVYHWALPAFCSMWSGMLLAACLRLDYQNHQGLAGTPAEFTLATVPAPEKPLVPLGTGVAVPTRAPHGFKKPFYLTAWAGWVLAQVIVIFIGAMLWEKMEISGLSLGVFSVIIEAAVMCSILVVGSLFRGELKTFWAYREVWKLHPQAKADHNVLEAGPDDKIEKPT